MEGFGDRLQCLLQVIQYCEKTKRTLVIDWRDSNWIQNHNESIEDYFTISKIPSVSIEKFLSDSELYKSIYPNAWMNCLDRKDYQKFIYQPKYSCGDNSIFNNICLSKTKDFEEDVVIYSGVRKRSYRGKYWNYIQYNSIISDQIKTEMDRYKIKEKKYNCIHIRAQNKYWLSGVCKNKNLRNRIKKKFANQSIYLRYLQMRLRDLNSKLPNIIMSDDLDSSHHFNKTYCNSECIVMDANTEEIGSLCGIHKKVFKDEASKKQINIKTLVDFHIMMKSKYIISDGISTFSNMARNLQNHDKP